MSDTPKPYESDTPETCEAVERWRQGKINIFDEMARLERERDKAQALVAEMKQAIVWAKAEAKERLHRLDQAACERRTWLEAHEKMKRERDEARAEAATLLRPAEAVEAFCLAHNHANKVEEAICSLSFQLQAADEHRRLAERLAEAAMFERDQLRMRVAELQNGIVVEGTQ